MPKKIPPIVAIRSEEFWSGSIACSSPAPASETAGTIRSASLIFKFRCIRHPIAITGTTYIVCHFLKIYKFSLFVAFLKPLLSKKNHGLKSAIQLIFPSGEKRTETPFPNGAPKGTVIVRTNIQHSHVDHFTNKRSRRYKLLDLPWPEGNQQAGPLVLG